MAHPFFEGTAFPWHLGEAGALRDALSESISLPQRIGQVYSQCGPGLPPLTPNLPSDVAWTEVLNNLGRAGLVRRLCLMLEGSGFPAVVAAIQRVRAAVDVVERTVLDDQGGLPFLDRKPLRALLEQTARDANALKVIVVRGEPGSGRTWTRHLVESVARSRKELPVYCSRGNTFGLDVLVTDLFDLLGAPELAPPNTTTTAAGYHAVCMKLVAAARRTQTRCWLTIDDLDADEHGTPLMDTTIREFFEQFAVDMMNPAVREWFRLVLLAYPAKSPPPTRWAAEHFRMDDTRPDAVEQGDVTAHLEVWAACQGRVLPAEEREQIALRVWQEAQAAAASARLRTLHLAIQSELAKLGGGS